MLEFGKIVFKQFKILLNTPKVHYKGPQIVNWGSGLRNKSAIPNIIWIYWQQGNDSKSSFVDICISRIRKFHPNHQVFVLNEISIKEYIDVPKFHPNLKIAQKADFYRLALIEKYGGIWMDASIFLNCSLDWLLNLYNGQDLIGFYTDECTSDIRFPIPENWFLCSPPNNKFIKVWISEFSQCLESSNPFHYYDSFLSTDNYRQKLTKPEYLLAYCSVMKIMRDRNDIVLSLIRSGSEGHFYNYISNWDGDKIAKYLLLNNDSENKPKMIKFNSGGRSAIDKYIRLHLYSKKSIIGKNL